MARLGGLRDSAGATTDEQIHIEKARTRRQSAEHGSAAPALPATLFRHHCSRNIGTRTDLLRHLGTHIGAVRSMDDEEGGRY